MENYSDDEVFDVETIRNARKVVLEAVSTRSQQFKESDRILEKVEGARKRARTNRNRAVQDLTVTNSNGNNDTKGIRISGSHNILKNLNFYGFTTAVLVPSDYNQFLNISVTNGADGFQIFGNLSSFLNITFQNISSYAAWILGDTNTISNIACDNCRNGIYLNGIQNWVANVDLRSPRYDYNTSSAWGLFVGGGSGNVLDHFQGQGHWLGLDCNSSAVMNSRFAGVDIYQFGNRLVNVDAGEWLMLSGSEHRVIRTIAKELVNEGLNVVFINSTFDSVWEGSV